MTNQIFEDWTSNNSTKVNILCPNLPDNKQFSLQGQETSWVTKNIMFKISICNSTERLLQGKSKCYEPSVIQKYLKEIEVEFWSC